MSPAPLLRLSGLTKQFGPLRAVHNVDLQVQRGDFVALFGPNGAGKTTLLRLIAALAQPTRGTIEFGPGGQCGRESVGYVSHQSLLYNELTGFENLQFYGRLYGLHDPGSKGRRRLEHMGLEEASGRLVRTYSRGMKQRLTLARALLHEPELLLLDEPYTGLDQHGSRLLTAVLRELREQGRTVLLITHNIAEGLELSTRLIIQHRGRLVLDEMRERFSRDQFEQTYMEVVGGGR